eukprot:scaffold13594_cov88-Isochrysis_galbana.AAC.2
MPAARSSASTAARLSAADPLPRRDCGRDRGGVVPDAPAIRGPRRNAASRRRSYASCWCAALDSASSSATPSDLRTSSSNVSCSWPRRARSAASSASTRECVSVRSRSSAPRRSNSRLALRSFREELSAVRLCKSDCRSRRCASASAIRRPALSLSACASARFHDRTRAALPSATTPLTTAPEAARGSTGEARGLAGPGEPPPPPPPAAAASRVSSCSRRSRTRHSSSAAAARWAAASSVADAISASYMAKMSAWAASDWRRRSRLRICRWKGAHA